MENNDSVANRLLTDEGMGQRVGRDLEAIVHDLASVAAKLDRGGGAAGMLINDPRIYDAVNDIVVGVNESRMLRWLIRSRQKKGIKARYEAAGGPPLSKAEERAPATADPPDDAGAAPSTGTAAPTVTPEPPVAPSPADGESEGQDGPAPVPPAATPAPTPPGGIA